MYKVCEYKLKEKEFRSKFIKFIYNTKELLFGFIAASILINLSNLILLYNDKLRANNKTTYTSVQLILVHIAILIIVVLVLLVLKRVLIQIFNKNIKTVEKTVIVVLGKIIYSTSIKDQLNITIQI